MNISVLGSTGSIGTQTLEVVREIGGVNLCALTANNNIELLERQIREFKPEIAVVMDSRSAEELGHNIKDCETKVLQGMEGLIEAAVYEKSDLVVTSVVGNVGIVPTYEAIRAGKNIALANKETLVSAGELIMSEAKKNGVNIYPVDSEHSAIFQCIQGNRENKIRRIILTASGGPFRGKTSDELKNVKAADALRHPNWNMGKKVTIDSSSLMNKGLEVIEAKWLFDVNVEDIEVVIHPQSIVHSAVEYEDGAIIAQMGEPDMRVPIQYAITYPKRVKNSFPKIDFAKRSTLTFEKPDMETFRCLALAYDAIETGGTMPAVMNSANEVAVNAFLENKIGFLDIANIIEKTMKAYNVKYHYTIDDLIEADKWARAFSNSLITIKEI
ncbi:1-deoxy-D-xylulose 5-phosphate reductoisomerase [Clostridiales bacterium]|nr:1-deoxy-D-xylulose 5-phosphate reductoisomerase [Clostridiales bacterium]